MSNTKKAVDKEGFRRCLNIAIARWIREELRGLDFFEFMRDLKRVIESEEYEVGISPIKNNEIDSKIRASFLQSPLNLCIIIKDLNSSLNAEPNIQATIGIK